jgi:hypothetical protein
MIAIIGAVRRLTDAGMTADDATDTVLRILEEERIGHRLIMASPQTAVCDRTAGLARRSAMVSSRQKASVPTLDAC